MSFQYQMQAAITPREVCRGAKVHFECKITNPDGEIKKVYFEVLGYGIKMKLNDDGNGAFSYDFEVPAPAPKGEYSIKLYAINTAGEHGEEKIEKMKVI